MRFIINPGAGPVEGGTFEQAKVNMALLAIECELASFESATDKHDDGRWEFNAVDKHGAKRVVLMPGLEYVAGQSILAFPRLYVDGGSWAWPFAVNLLTETEEEL